MSHSLTSVGRFILVLYILTLPSCLTMSGITQWKFESLKPGMTVGQVGEIAGAPDRTVGEVTTAYGQDVVVWEYEKFSSPGMKDDIYWVYIVDGQFLKYTFQGDWQQEREIIFHTEYSIPSSKN